MRIVHDPGDLDGGPCVLVPTMGALHEGHASLIRAGSEIARQRGLAGGCVVSVFVNPTQFNEAADFERYPRTLEADAEICREAGAAAVFAPEREAVYPPGVGVPTPRLPDVATRPRLEDAMRPGHFKGVCQVVKRLFDLVQPRVAVFGEKDWQQLQVVEQLTSELRLRVTIVPGRTVRESDGLAMSSRNRFLSAQERPAAGAVARALVAGGKCSTPATAERRMRMVLEGAGLRVEYAAVRDAWTLERPRRGRPMRALVAARLGTVRLIDNAPWPCSGLE